MVDPVKEDGKTVRRHILGPKPMGCVRWLKRRLDTLQERLEVLERE